MFVGVLIAGIAIVMAMSAAGWLLGWTMDIGMSAETQGPIILRHR
jgi:hypothetical protein